MDLIDSGATLHVAPTAGVVLALLVVRVKAFESMTFIPFIDERKPVLVHVVRNKPDTPIQMVHFGIRENIAILDVAPNMNFTDVVGSFLNIIKSQVHGALKKITVRPDSAGRALLRQRKAG